MGKKVPFSYRHRRTWPRLMKWLSMKIVVIQPHSCMRLREGFFPHWSILNGHFTILYFIEIIFYFSRASFEKIIEKKDKNMQKYYFFSPNTLTNATFSDQSHELGHIIVPFGLFGQFGTWYVFSLLVFGAHFFLLFSFWISVLSEFVSFVSEIGKEKRGESPATTRTHAKTRSIY